MLHCNIYWLSVSKLIQCRAHPIAHTITSPNLRRTLPGSVTWASFQNVHPSPARNLRLPCFSRSRHPRKLKEAVYISCVGRITRVRRIQASEHSTAGSRNEATQRIFEEVLARCVPTSPCDRRRRIQGAYRHENTRTACKSFCITGLPRRTRVLSSNLHNSHARREHASPGSACVGVQQWHSRRPPSTRSGRF